MWVSSERLRQRHRRWLAAHDLLERPWYVLGSAPNPTVPKEFLDRAAFICINNAASAAKGLGLRPADLTFRNKSKEWKTLAGHKVPLMIWVCNRPSLLVEWKRFIISRDTELGEIRVMRRAERRLIGEAMLRAPGSTDNIGKPSTGIFAVLYGIFVGVPEIVFGGFSMDKKGYSYEADRMRMLHRDEDEAALEIIARSYPNVSTTEQVVAKATGVPLFGSELPANGPLD